MSRLLIGLASIVLVTRIAAMSLPAAPAAPTSTPSASAVPSLSPEPTATPQPTLLPLPSLPLPSICITPPACGRLIPPSVCLPVLKIPGC